MTRKRYAIVSPLGSPVVAAAALVGLDRLGYRGSGSGESLALIAAVGIAIFVVGVGLATRRAPGEVAAVLGAPFATTLAGGAVYVAIALSRAGLN